MGKLGKKARKFAKKNLQSVHKRNRKSNTFFKKKKAPRNELSNGEVHVEETKASLNERKPPNEDLVDDSLEIFPAQDDDVLLEEGSDSDGSLDEDSSFRAAVEIDSENHLEERGEGSTSSEQNQKIQSEIVERRKKLEKLKKKHPGFKSFLENHLKNLEILPDEEMVSNKDDISASNNGRLLTSFVVKNWSLLVKEQKDMAALPCLLNAYRAACHIGVNSSTASHPRFQNHETFCSIIIFVLGEADNIFRNQLGILSDNCKIEAVRKLENTSKWKTLKPMIKSYLCNTLFLLSRATDADILVYVIAQLRTSLVLFAAFPSLLHKLIQVAVRLWVTGVETSSSSSFLLLRDVGAVFESDLYNDCLKKMYKAYVSSCRFVEPVNLKHIHCIRDQFIEFCSIDLQKSTSMALASTQRLAEIFQLSLQYKKEEALKKLSSWEYALCIDLWVMFASTNGKDNDLHGILFLIIQVINGMTQIFMGPRYFPLRVRCIQWLNHISSSSGMFLPVSSLILDLIEYKIVKEGGKPVKGDKFPNTLKLPKYWLKSPKFQQECVLFAIELLSAHFARWSFHVSFPEMATIPVIHLRKFLEKSTDESLRTQVKQLIDQVEKNVDYVQRKREDVSLMARENSFVQIEKGSGNLTFSQYYQKHGLKKLLQGT